jgi:hypothetical protein
MDNAAVTHYEIANFYHKEHEGKAAKNTKTKNYSVSSVKDFVPSVVKNAINVKDNALFKVVSWRRLIFATYQQCTIANASWE